MNVNVIVLSQLDRHMILCRIDMRIHVARPFAGDAKAASPWILFHLFQDPSFRDEHSELPITFDTLNRPFKLFSKGFAEELLNRHIKLFAKDNGESRINIVL